MQMSLFEVASDPTPDLAYRSPVVCSVTGVTYRQLDYWVRTGLIVPSIVDAQGSGNSRLYSFKDILIIKIIAKLLESGISLQNVRLCVQEIGKMGEQEITSSPIVSDGIGVYLIGSDQEYFDLLRYGQGVFGIAAMPIAQELKNSIIKFPGEKIDPHSGQISPCPSAPHMDELAMRRIKKQAS